MDLNYPAETEPFRKEVRAWLEENLPEGWFDPDFSMNPEERRAFNEGWNEKALRRRLDLRRMARRIRRQRTDAAPTSRVERGVRQGRCTDAR